jgi:hypothetical protein
LTRFSPSFSEGEVAEACLQGDREPMQSKPEESSEKPGK